MPPVVFQQSGIIGVLGSKAETSTPSAPAAGSLGHFDSQPLSRNRSGDWHASLIADSEFDYARTPLGNSGVFFMFSICFSLSCLVRRLSVNASYF
jgi:hypothetical protein